MPGSKPNFSQASAPVQSMQIVLEVTSCPSRGLGKIRSLFQPPTSTHDVSFCMDVGGAEEKRKSEFPLRIFSLSPSALVSLRFLRSRSVVTYSRPQSINTGDPLSESVSRFPFVYPYVSSDDHVFELISNQRIKTWNSNKCIIRFEFEFELASQW